MQLGCRTPGVDSLKLATAQEFYARNYRRIENAHKVRKKSFVFHYVAVICTTNGEKEQIRACVSRYDQSA